MDINKLYKIKLKKHYQEISKKTRRCLHPNCNSLTINSHTVSRSKNLKRISSNSHVYSIENMIFKIGSDDYISYELISTKKASGYPLFCEEHDNNLFKPFERNKLQINQEHSFLLHYRIINKKLYLKQNIYDLYTKQIKYFKKEQDFIFDLKQQRSLFGTEIRSLNEQKNILDELLLKHDFTNQSFYTLIIDKIPEIQCSETWIPILDFDNNELFDLNNLDLKTPSISINILAFENSGIILFSWNNEQNIYNSSNIKFIHSLNKIENKLLGVLSIIFSFTENIFINPSWWDNLSNSKQQLLKDLPLKAIQTGTDLSNYNDLEGLIDWNIINIETNIILD